MTPEMAGHFDACLGCMACVTACPSGRPVRPADRADPGRGRTRARPRRRTTAPSGRSSSQLFPYPRRLRALRLPMRLSRGGCQTLPGRGCNPSLGAMADLAPPPSPRVRLPRKVHARGPARATVGMLTGCVQGEFFPRSTRPRPGCSRWRAATWSSRRPGLLRGAVAALRPRRRRPSGSPSGRSPPSSGPASTPIVVNAAGCGSTMKDYAEILPTSPNGRQGPRRSGPRPGRISRRARPGRRAAPAAADRGLPRRLPSGPRAGHPHPAP